MYYIYILYRYIGIYIIIIITRDVILWKNALFLACYKTYLL